MTLSDIGATAKRLVKIGGDEALRGYSLLVVSSKNGDVRDVVTNVDVAISTLLKKEIANLYPDHAFYSEEEQQSINPDIYTWVIDPIDGTSNYARGLPHYGVCITVLYKDAVVSAVVYNPVTQELFIVDQGVAYYNEVPMHVSGVRDLKEAYVNFHPGRRVEDRTWAGELQVLLLGNACKSVNLAASGLDLCYTACGKTDMVIYGTLSTLDVAGAIAMLRAAGGEVYVYATQQPVLFSQAPQRIIATNNALLLDNFFKTSITPT
jgi:myo-inositol-1(or 4)-monophosphatase